MKSALMCAAVIFAFAGTAYAKTPDKVVPMGETVGITLETKGVIVEDVTEYENEDGTKSAPAKDAGIKAVDIITHIGSVEITCAEDIKKALDGSGGDDVTVKLVRGSEEKQVSVTPRAAEKGGYEIGLWLRDGVMGLGTITFYDKESGVYGALGHPISDSKTESAIPAEDGEIHNAEITEIVKGKSGSPGQLHGDIDMRESIGTIDSNTICGIYGKMEECELLDGKSEIDVAAAKEIETGPAQIISAVSGEIETYDLEITRVYNTGAEDNKSMMLTVTDDDLVSLTGGIVQGMSGSPIIQNGKIIGAVTHVLVNDPLKGYGVSIENMLAQAEKAA